MDRPTVEPATAAPDTLRARFQERLSDALPRLRARIRAAAEAGGREASDVTLVAVTKAHPMAAVEAAVAAGLRDLGENRVEELAWKAEGAGDGAIRWHMIGHVQRRKAEEAMRWSDLIHSVDTVRLAERLSRLAERHSCTAQVLVQVNTSGETSKSGFRVDGAVEQIHRVAELSGVRVCGLMTMAPFVDDETVLGGAFAALRCTLERLRAAGAPVGGELSMGMTNDLEIAIREGSTMVRIGTALFGARNP